MHRGISILLSVMIVGTGHIYLGYIRKGIVIILSVIGLAVLAFGFERAGIERTIAIIPIIALWIWQILDVNKCFNRLKENEVMKNQLRYEEPD